jgi:hypothetical protein
MSDETKETKAKKINAFKDVVKDRKFVEVILPDVTGINLSEQEIQKLKVYLRYESKGTLFDSISSIYGVIGANFSNPSGFIVIPYIDSKNKEHINIQKIL